MYTCEECNQPCGVIEEFTVDMDEFWGQTCYRTGYYLYSTCCNTYAYEGEPEGEDENE